MARPKKDYRVKWNGSSLQVFEQGVYVGSIPAARLCQMLRDEKVPE